MDFLDFYLQNDYSNLELTEIEEFYSKKYFNDLILDKKINQILSLKQNEDFTYFYLDPIKVIKYFQLEFVISKIRRRCKTDNVLVDKLSIADSSQNLLEVTSRRYNYICPSCNKEISLNLNQFYQFLQRKSLVCKICKNKVSHRLNKYKKKYSDSMIKKYGDSVPLNNQEIKNKFKETMKTKYNCESPFHNGVLRDKHYITMMKTYNKKAVSPGWGRNSSSLLETEFIKKFLSVYSGDLRNVFSNENSKQWFVLFNKERRWIDLYLKEEKVAIQIHGDFWHGNLNVFNKDEIHPILKKTFGEIRKESDELDEKISKHKSIKKYIVVWESSIKSNINIIDSIYSIIKEKSDGKFYL